MKDKFKDILKNLPTTFGVYFYKDKNDKIIYIGKAKNLRSRVKSYFLNIGKHQQFKTEILVKKIHSIEYIITDNELEALLLESNLIKKHRPKYNIDLKDDKSYPYIRITKELFPQIFITRKIIDDGSKYIGPFMQVKGVRNLLKNLKKILRFRNCKLNITQDSIDNKRHKVCLDHHIKICNGPCEGLENASNYNERIKNIAAFFNGRKNKLNEILVEQMKNASTIKNYESAAEYRDATNLVETFSQRQKVENATGEPTDYFAVEIEDNDACCVVFKLRSGRLIARNNFFLKSVYGRSASEVLDEFIKLYYNISQHDIPYEIVSAIEIDDKKTIEQWLSSLDDHKVKIFKPSIGDKIKLLFLAQKNAKMLLNDMKLEKMKKDFTPRSLNSLMRDLDLKKIPNIIECFDISHFAGKETVASMVTFKNAKPYKTGYRRFKINTVAGIDDFASMREVVVRRYKRLSEEDDPIFPDLLMVDGGKGQLSSAVKILKDLGLSEIPIIGLAKRLEEVFVPGKSEAVFIPRTSSALILLQRVRDEAHRFAITYHKNLRGKTIGSQLEDIKGVGPATRKLLIQKFSSLKRIKEASVEDLMTVKGVTEELAIEIKEI
ncbi:MAG: excinuclease ABC subunit UvrC [Candidatus Delongbacteria bacterium]|jgi:excinuclease ABC subunit C|nr:excinuclease ABC subunit UvrC [Candidatus Delongbacteria bacterium]